MPYYNGRINFVLFCMSFFPALLLRPTSLNYIFVDKGLAVVNTLRPNVLHKSRPKVDRPILDARKVKVPEELTEDWVFV